MEGEEKQKYVLTPYSLTLKIMLIHLPQHFNFYTSIVNGVLDPTPHFTYLPPIDFKLFPFSPYPTIYL